VIERSNTNTYEIAIEEQSSSTELAVAALPTINAALALGHAPRTAATTAVDDDGIARRYDRRDQDKRRPVHW